MDIDGQEAERFDIRLAPNPSATIEQEALDVAGVTLEQIQSYQPMEEGYRQLVGILSKYVDKFDKRDKMYLVGYNNAGFDNNFLRALFQQCGDKYFGSWFYPNCMDVYVMVTPFLMGVRNDMENFKLMTVARTMGIEIDENKLHDATYDIELTKEMDIDISSITYLPEPDVFNVMYTEHMSVILDRVNKIIDDNKDKLKNPTCSTCVHLHDNDWAKRYGKVCCSVWQVCDHYINPNRKYDRKQKTYARRPSNKACPNYEYGDDNFENRRRCIKEKNTQ